MSFEKKITDLQKQILSVHNIVVPLDTLIILIKQSSELSISNKYQSNNTTKKYNTADINRAKNIGYKIGHKQGHEDGGWNFYKLLEENDLIKTKKFNNQFKHLSPRHQITSSQITSRSQLSPRHKINSRRKELSYKHQTNYKSQLCQKKKSVEEFENDQDFRPPIYGGYKKN